MTSTLLPNTMKRNRSSSFEVETRAVLSDLRDALAAVIGQIRPDILRAADLRRVLDLNTKLSWSLFTAATTDDLSTLASVIPGARPMGRFFDVVSAYGVSEEYITKAKDAFERFEFMVRRHAAGRDVFDAMVSSISTSNDDIVDEKLRKRMFNDQSILWGMRSRVSHLCFIDRPGSQSGMTDSLIILGCRQLQQLREGERLFNLVTETAFGEASDADKLRDHLASAAGAETRSPMMLLEEFCSQPLPQLAAQGVPGWSPGGRTVLQLPGLGRSAAIDFAMVQTARAPGAKAGVHSVFQQLTCPSEVTYCDFLVPAGESDPRSVRGRVYANRISTSRVFERNAEDQIPMKVSVMHCGRISFPLATERERAFVRSPLSMAEMPRYSEMLNHMVEKLSWNDVEYDAYRCHVRYPLMQALIEIVVDPLQSPR